MQTDCDAACWVISATCKLLCKCLWFVADSIFYIFESVVVLNKIEEEKDH